MKVCLSCYQYETKCLCNKSNKQPEIVEIDDDFADLILELNELFSYLGLDLRTKFCCAGHLTPREIAPNITSALHSYIMFEGNFLQFAYFINGLDKVQEEPLFKNNPDLVFSADVVNQEEQQYTLSVGINKFQVKYTLEDKILFMQGKTRMMQFLSDIIKRKWMEIDNDWDDGDI